MATLNASGLPAGATVIVQDNLYVVKRGAEQHGLIVRVLTVPASGRLTVPALRDSRYALLFTDPRLVPHAVFALDVGDPARFRRTLVHRIPPAVSLVSATAAGETVELVWRLSPEGFEADRYSAWARAAGESTWAEVGAVARPQARSLVLTGLAPDTDTEIRVKAENSEGRSRGGSNVRTVRTNTAVAGNGNLVSGGSFEKSVWN